MIDPVLFTICGPFAVHAYGVAIFIGIALALFLSLVDYRRARIINKDDLFSLISWSIFIGIISARILHIILDSYEYPSIYSMLAFWNGGFAIMGTLCSVPLFLCFYSYFYSISLMPLLDLIGTYAPLAQAFGRIGCFFAGCCYGVPSSIWCSIMYTSKNSLAPLHCSLHPTQLYSASLFFILSAFLTFFAHKKYKVGQIFFFYLSGAGFIRFITDFARSDQIYNKTLPYFSEYQWIALGVIILGVFGFSLATFSFFERSSKN